VANSGRHSATSSSTQLDWKETRENFFEQTKSNSSSSSSSSSSTESKSEAHTRYLQKHGLDIDQLHTDESSAETFLDRYELDEEKQFFQHLWTLVRCGQHDRAVQACHTAGQSWRAASIKGLLMAHNASLSDQPSAASSLDTACTGNVFRTVWKQACIALSNKPSLDRFERAIYAVLCGNYPQVLPVCENWHDYLWAHLSGFLEQEISRCLDASSSGEQSTLFTNPHGEDVTWREANVLAQSVSSEPVALTSLDDIFEYLRNTSPDHIQSQNENQFFQVQRLLILDQYSEALRYLREHVQQHTCTIHFKRFAAHFAIFFQHHCRSIANQTEQQHDILCILSIYIRLLIDLYPKEYSSSSSTMTNDDDDDDDAPQMLDDHPSERLPIGRLVALYTRQINASFENTRIDLFSQFLKTVSQFHHEQSAALARALNLKIDGASSSQKNTRRQHQQDVLQQEIQREKRDCLVAAEAAGLPTDKIAQRAAELIQDEQTQHSILREQQSLASTDDALLSSSSTLGGDSLSSPIQWSMRFVTRRFDIEKSASKEIDSEDQVYIDAIEWICFNDATRPDALIKANSLARKFLYEYKFYAAMRLMQHTLPQDTVHVVERINQNNAQCFTNAIAEYHAIQQYLHAIEAFSQWRQHTSQRPSQRSSSTSSSRTKKVPRHHREPVDVVGRKQYQAQLKQWKHKDHQLTRVTIERMMAVLTFPNGWLVDKQPDPHHTEIDRVQQLHDLRQRCLPPLVFLLHRVYTQNNRYHESLKLADLVADEKYCLYKVFTKSDLEKLMGIFRSTTLKILASKSKTIDPLGYF